MTNILKNGYRRKSRVMKTRSRKPRKSPIYSRKYKKQSRMRIDMMKSLKNIFKSFSTKIKKSMSRKKTDKNIENKKPENKTTLKDRHSKELFKHQQLIAEEEDILMNLLSEYKETKNKDLIKDIDSTKTNIIRLGREIDRLDKNLKRYRKNELLERRILKNKIIEE